jgi:hypothetical protein
MKTIETIKSGSKQNVTMINTFDEAQFCLCVHSFRGRNYCDPPPLVLFAAD